MRCDVTALGPLRFLAPPATPKPSPWADSWGAAEKIRDASARIFAVTGHDAEDAILRMCDAPPRVRLALRLL